MRAVARDGRVRRGQACRLIRVRRMDPIPKGCNREPGAGCRQGCDGGSGKSALPGHVPGFPCGKRARCPGFEFRGCPTSGEARSAGPVDPVGLRINGLEGEFGQHLPGGIGNRRPRPVQGDCDALGRRDAKDGGGDPRIPEAELERQRAWGNPLFRADPLDRPNWRKPGLIHLLIGYARHGGTSLGEYPARIGGSVQNADALRPGNVEEFVRLPVKQRVAIVADENIEGMLPDEGQLDIDPAHRDSDGVGESFVAHPEG